MAAKVPVKGSDAHPLFRWFAQQGGLLSKPRWNFFKYVVARDGSLSTWFTSATTPESAKLRTALDRVVATAT